MAGRASTGFDFHAFANADVPTRVARLRRLAWLLDAALRLPGTRMRVGLNGLLGAPPAIGDLLMGAVSMIIVVEAYHLGVPTPLLLRMLANIAIETAAGSVPVVGDLFDAAFKANLRNLAIVEGYFGLNPRR